MTSAALALCAVPASSSPRRREHRRLRRMMRSGVIVLIVVLGSFVAMPTVALAHTDLTSSVPSANDTLRVPPALIRLRFNEAVAKDFANLTVAVGAGSPVALLVEVNGDTVAADIPASLRTPGPSWSQRWLVAYRIVSEDGHPVTGTLGFTVAAPGASRPSPSASQPATPSPGVGGSTDVDHEERGVVSVRQLSDPGANAWLPTAVIGVIAASAVAAALVWLVRGRRRDQRE